MLEKRYEIILYASNNSHLDFFNGNTELHTAS